MIQFSALVLAFIFSKIFRKLLFVFTFLAGCGVIFYYIIYPKVMENENMKYAIEYFKFWHKLPEEKEGTIKFLSDSFEKNHGDYKVAIGFKLMRQKNLRDADAIAFLEKLKTVKNRSKLTDNLINIKLSDLHLQKDYKKSIKYLDKVSKNDPLFVYAKEEKMKILLTKTDEYRAISRLNNELREYYNDNVDLYPYYEKVESFIESRIK